MTPMKLIGNEIIHFRAFIGERGYGEFRQPVAGGFRLEQAMIDSTYNALLRRLRQAQYVASAITADGAPITSAYYRRQRDRRAEADKIVAGIQAEIAALNLPARKVYKVRICDTRRMAKQYWNVAATGNLF